MSLPLSTISSANLALSFAVIQPSVTAAPVAAATSLVVSATLSAAAFPASTALSAPRLVSSVARSLQAGATRSATLAILIRCVLDLMAFGVCNEGDVDLELCYGRVRHFGDGGCVEF